jgi:type VI secretion system secreted protein VgrG
MKPVKIELKIDNKDVPSPTIESLELNQLIGGHHFFNIELRRKPELEQAFGKSMEANVDAWLSKTMSLKISAADKSFDDPGEVRFLGIVTAVNFSSKVDSLGNICIKGFSPTIMLDLNRIYRVWCDMSANDIMNSLISDEGLPNANMQATGGTTLPGFLAHNDTPFEILKYLADFEGWWLFYDGLNFNVANDLPDDNLDLKANDLDSFMVELDATRLKGVTGAAFEYVQGNWFQASSPNPSQSGQPLGKAAGSAGKVTESQEMLVVPHNPLSQQDLDQRVQIIQKKSYARLLKSTGKTDKLGLIPGKCLKVDWKPKKAVTESRREEGFDGLYLIVNTVHSYKDAKYECDFKCVVRDLAFPAYDTRQLPAQLFETGRVTEVSDPEGNKLARVKVRFSWDSENADGMESPLLRVCQLQAGADNGSWIIPEVGESVIVSIRGRHLENALVIGSVFDGSGLPRDDVYTDDNMIKSIYTKSGNEITIVDTAGEEKITLKAKSDTCTVIMDATDGGEKVSVTVNSEGAKMVLDGSSGGEKVSISSNDAKLTIDGSGRAISLETDGTIKLKANEIKIEAGATLDLKSNGTAKLNPATNLDLQAGAVVKVQGALIQLN